MAKETTIEDLVLLDDLEIFTVECNNKSTKQPDASENKHKNFYHKYRQKHSCYLPDCSPKIISAGNDKIQFTKHGTDYVKIKGSTTTIVPVINRIPYATHKVEEYTLNNDPQFSIYLGIHNTEMNPIKVQMSQLSSGSFLANHLPHEVIIKSQKYFPYVIKRIAENVPLDKIHKYPGFTKEFNYVHSGGIISRKKIHNERSDPDIGTLTISYTSATPKECVACINRIFKLEPVFTIMLAFMLLSLSYSKFGIEKPRFVFLLWGITGSFKSSISTHMFSIFSEYYSTAPVNLKVATMASLHRILPEFRDSVCLLDDAAPSASGNNETFEKCESITRAVGDQTGRATVGSNRKVENSKPVGMVAITGEMVPFRTSSDLGRCVMYKLHKNSISSEKLSEIQDEKDVYIHVIVDYISWICDKREDYISEITSLHLEYRKNCQEYSKLHARTPDNISWLAASFSMFLKFCKEYYDISSKKADKWSDIFWDAIEISLADQREYMKDKNDAKMFIKAVESLYSHNNNVLSRIQTIAKNKKIAFEDKVCIGYFDDNYIYLKAEEAYAQTKHWLKSHTDQAYALPMKGLYDLMREKGYIKPSSDGKTKSRLSINGDRPSLIRIKRKYINI